VGQLLSLWDVEKRRFEFKVIAKDINAAAIAATRGDITFTFSNKHYL